MPAPRQLLGPQPQPRHYTPLMGRDAVLSNYNPTLAEKLTDFMARNWYGDSREGTRKAEKAMNVLNFTPVGAATGMYDAGRAAGQGDYMGAGLNLAMAGVPAAKGIRAYHGSPHDFDKFDMGKIGTGEGAQAYGHGLYFAEKEGVARGYRDGLTPNFRNTLNYAGPDRSRNAAAMLAADIPDEQVLAGLAALDDPNPQASLEAGRKILADARASGKMYEVQINADPDQFLDWDKPLSEQPGLQPAFDNMKLFGELPEAETGEQLYRGLDRKFVQDFQKRNNSSPAGHFQDLATDKLKFYGIPGIKYLDQGSRGAPIANIAKYEKKVNDLRSAMNANPSEEIANRLSDAEQELASMQRMNAEPTRNYVVFDDKLIDIRSKYGMAGLLGMLGYGAMSNNDAQAAPARIPTVIDAKGRPYYASK